MFVKHVLYYNKQNNKRRTKYHIVETENEPSKKKKIECQVNVMIKLVPFFGISF